MKKIIIQSGFLLMVTFFSLQSWAQDKVVDVNITTGKNNPEWYQQPWVWIAGGAVFILLLVAIAKGGRKKE